MKLPTLLCFLPLAMAAACASTRESNPTTESTALASSLALRDPRFVGEGASRALEVTLQNLSGDALDLAVQVAWFDVRGEPVKLAPRLEQTAELPARGEARLRFRPVPIAAASYRFSYTPR